MFISYWLICILDSKIRNYYDIIDWGNKYEDKVLIYLMCRCYIGVKCSGLEFHWRKVDICSIFCSCFLVRTKTISLHQNFLFFQDVLLAAFGSLFFLSIGAKIIDIWRPVVMKNYGCFGNAQALGALSILTSFLYLGDACFNVITLRKE